MSDPIQNNFLTEMMIFNREYSDIPLICFMRNPFAKNASFTYMIANIDITMYVNMQKLISRNEFPSISTKIFSTDEANPLKLCRDNKISKIYDRDLYCIHIDTDDNLDYKQETVSAKLILVHPIFLQLEKRNTYNTIDNNKTVYESLTNFESYLTKTFGDIFKFRHIISNNNKNNTKMEQLLVRTNSDLSVPEYLQNTYKSSISPAFYFFDDFYLDKDSDKEITCHYISLTDVNLFKTVTDNNNITISSINVLKEEPFFHHFKPLYEADKRTQSENTTKYNKDFNSTEFGQIPVKGNSGISNINLDNGNIQVPNNGKLNYQKADKSQVSGIAQEGTEDSSNVDNRLNIYTKTIDKIKSIVYAEINDCLPFYLQFGKLYAINLETIDKHDITPLNIVNIFYKRSGKDELTMSHIVKFIGIRYSFSNEQESIPSIKV